MRIALDATYSVDPHPSGIAVYSRELIAGLRRIYQDDEFLACYRPKQFGRSEISKRRLLLPPLLTFRADLFHALNQRIDRRPARAVVSTFHDLFVITNEYSSPEFRARFTEQAWGAAERSDLIIAVSEFTANQVASLLGFDRSRIRVVPHGVHVPVQQPTARRENMILFVGALQIRKNIVRLVEAFEQLPPDWTLVLAGAPRGYGAEAILNRIAASSRRASIQIAGYVSPPELSQLYSRASIFAFPSLDEGFGIPVLEAMAYRVPVVTSNRGALLEAAGDAALLVNPEDTASIRSAMDRLIHDSNLRSKLAERGRIRASEYSWERAVRSTYAVYKEAMAGRPLT